MAKTRSLRTLLSACVVVLSVTPVFCISVVSSGLLGEHLGERIGLSLTDAASQIADKLDRSMFERWEDIRILAAHDAQIDQQQTAANLRAKLEELRKDLPEYAWIGFAGTDGIVMVSTGGLLEGADVSARPWYKAGIQNSFAGDVHEAVLLAKKLPPDPNGDPLRFVDIAMPVKRADGVPIGVLGAHLSWSWSTEIRNSVLKILGSGGPLIDAMIVDQAGTVLMGPEDMMGDTLDLPAIRAARQGSSRYSLESWPDGRQYMTAAVATSGYRGYPGLGWVVIVREDAEGALYPVRKLQITMLAIGFAAAMAAVIAGIALSRIIAHPLKEIAAAADKMRRGEVGIVIPHTNAYREASKLASALADLDARLRRKNIAKYDDAKISPQAHPDSSAETDEKTD